MPTPDNRQDLSAVLRKTADLYDDDPGVETMLRVAADEIDRLTATLADRTRERDAARADLKRLRELAAPVWPTVKDLPRGHPCDS